MELSFLAAKQKEKIFTMSLRVAIYLLEEPQPCLILSPERNLPTLLLGTETGLTTMGTSSGDICPNS